MYCEIIDSFKNVIIENILYSNWKISEISSVKWYQLNITKQIQGQSRLFKQEAKIPEYILKIKKKQIRVYHQTWGYVKYFRDGM